MEIKKKLLFVVIFLFLVTILLNLTSGVLIKSKPIFAFKNINYTLDKSTVLFKIETSEKSNIDYIDTTVSRPRWQNLCSGCTKYSGKKKFSNGEHNLTIRAHTKKNQVIQYNITFYIGARPVSNNSINNTNQTIDDWTAYLLSQPFVSCEFRPVLVPSAIPHCVGFEDSVYFDGTICRYRHTCSDITNIPQGKILFHSEDECSSMCIQTKNSNKVPTFNSNFTIKDGVEYYLSTDKSIYKIGENVSFTYRLINLKNESIDLGRLNGGHFGIFKLYLGNQIIGGYSEPKITSDIIPFILEKNEIPEMNFSWNMYDDKAQIKNPRTKIFTNKDFSAVPGNFTLQANVATTRSSIDNTPVYINFRII